MGKRKLTSVPVSAAGFHFLLLYCVSFRRCESLLFNLQFAWRMPPTVLEDYMRSLVMCIFYIWMLLDVSDNSM